MRPETNRAPGRLASALLAIAALATAWPAVPLLAQGGIPAYALPLQRGNSWTYDGTVWWVPHSRRVLEERVTLEMEVVEVVEWGRMRGAILKGFPRDLVTAAPDRFAGEFTLFQIGSTVHLLRGEAGREAIRRLRDRDASVADLVRDSEVVLDLPLTAGETFCSRDGSSGSRSRVCWSVEKEDPVEVLPVAGVPARRHRERYILDLRSGAEDEIRGFVPGVGFTSFAIGNFGDPSALELELVEVHLMAPPGTFLKTLDLADGPAVEMATDSRSPEPESPSLSAADPSNAAGAALAASTATTQAPAGEDVADAAPAPPAEAASPDTDGDGVPDEADGCAGSAAGEIVDRRGCSLPPPERIVERREAPGAPAVRVALEAIPVPDYEEPACLDDREWFLSGQPIEFDGRSFDPIGTPEPIALENLVPVGEYDGVPLYVGRNAREPHMDVWLPVCRTPNTFRLYADLGPRN